MNQEAVTIPTARSWRDIVQPMKTDAMSREGRWRRTLKGLRHVALAATLAGLCWGGWHVLGTVGAKPRGLPAVAAGTPLRRIELATSTGGVLDSEWLRRTLAIPAGATLMGLDLDRLRARLLSEGQVASATLARNFPDSLVVRITERTPVARVRVERKGRMSDLLVASDGHVFQGSGFEDSVIEGLPWLSGLTLVPEDAGFRPLPGIEALTQLLADAQMSAMHLYRDWTSISIARLSTDREMEVTTKTGVKIVFGATGHYFVQLAKLDYLLGRLAPTLEPGARMRIDLTLGRTVPVMVEPPAAGATMSAPQPASSSFSPFFSVNPT